MFYKKITVLLFGILFFSPTSALWSFHGKSNDSHAIYIGVIQMRHSPNRPTAHILVKVFQDDLRDVLRHAFGLKKMKGEMDFHIQHTKEIEQYFQAHFQCSINEQQVDLSFKKVEKQNDVYALNFEIKYTEIWKTIAIKADFFMELFPAQSNILQVENGKEKRFGRLKKGDKALRFEF